MTPEELFHTWYATQASLTALLPAASVFTGQVRDDTQAVPYATISIQRQSGTHTNSGSTFKGELEFELFIRKWQDGRDLLDELYSLLDNADTSGGGMEITVARFRHEHYMHEPDGVEHLMATYAITVN